VDAEEKRLSHNPEDGPCPTRQIDFRLHYFPDIPVDDPASVRVCVPLEDKFQRVRYDRGDSNCPDLPSDYGSNQAQPNKNPAATGRLDAQSYQEGFNEGLEKGLNEGEKTGSERAARKLEPVLDSLRQALLQLQTLRQDTYQRIEKEVVELALAIARKVICREIAVDKEVVVCVAREALAKVEDPGKITLKLNPSDLQFINETKYQLSEMIGNIDNITLEPEGSIQSGGCVVETELGQIDARIEHQLQAVEESFRTALEKARTED
jgi:flagellar biosynthesis/type III secretory pathway protein FliH